MNPPLVAFRLTPAQLERQLQQFNERAEVRWFGFAGAFQAPGTAVITVSRLGDGVLGGGGTSALNGGVIAAGLDAAFVLAGLGHYEGDVVVTTELSVQFLSLATIDRPLAFTAGVVRSSRRFSFVRGILAPVAEPSTPVFASATGMVAPAR